ncbi:MAG: Unknown protein [uncultured Sulfurovum sp.]|uniref:Uncharacterized protein n=1 Tax=uncultured Sulfurovum sp. TaxID=269237 RepID=A0A6S6U9D3_9BACT|nr:MAG: Unknown protein [uncultured Sulfurovum sp.]
MKKNKVLRYLFFCIEKQSVIGSMAGKYRDRVTKFDDLESAKEIAMIEEIGEKFDGKLSFDKDVNKKC